MRWFYLIATVVVLGLLFLPMLWIKGEDLGRFEGKVVAYNIYGSKVRSIDPATCGDTTSTAIQSNFYEGLYGYHYLKRPIELIPVLAEGMPEISDDGLTYTIRLRKDVRYARNECFGRDADGRPATRTVRAEDFVLAFKRIGDYHVVTTLSLAFIHDRIEGLAEYRERTRLYAKGDFSRYDKEDLPGVRALDEHTLRIRLREKFPQLVYLLAMHVYAPVPREVIDYYLTTESDGRGGRRPVAVERRSAEINESEAAVGTGPYVLTQWVRAAKIVLERNGEFRDEHYPGEGEPGDREAGLLDDAGKKVPFIDVIDLTFVAETNPAWMLFATKQRDTAGIPRDVYTRVISPSKALLEQWGEQGIRLIKDDSSMSVYWYAFNLEDPVLGASKSLRQAMCLAYDVEEHIELLFNGRGLRALNTLPRSFKGHAEAGPSPYARYDLRAATAKLAQARTELAAAGIIPAGGSIPPLTLDMPGREEYFVRMGEIAQRQFRRIGIELNVVLNDWPTLQEKVHNKRCQMYAMGWQADYPDAENFLQLYYTPNIERGTNNTNYSSRPFDERFARAAVEMDEVRRVELYAQMVRILNEDCPVLLLSEPITFLLAHPWAHNIKLHPIGSGYLKYERIDAALRRKLGGR